MSIIRCHRHSRHWDSDIEEECPRCLDDAVEESTRKEPPILCIREKA